MVVSYSEYEKRELETFKKFLSKLETFLEDKAVFKNAKPEVLYLHEPDWKDDVYYSRGVVKIGNLEYPVEIKFDTIDKVIRIRSEVLHLTLLKEEMEEFLNKGGKNE